MKFNYLQKILISFTCFSTILFLFSSCTSCSSSNTSGNTPEIIPDVVIPIDAGSDASMDANSDSSEELKKTIQGDTWSIQVPSNGFETSNPTPDILVSVAVEQPVQYVVALAREPASSKDEFIIYSIRGLRASGAKIISTSNTYINNNDYTLIEVEKDSIKVLMWATVKNNMGYALSCGGPGYDDLLASSCQEVASTLQIK